MRIQMSAVGLTTLLARNLLSRAPRRLANAASIASPAGIQTSCASGILFGDSELQQSWRPCLQPQRRLFATTSSSQKPGSRDGESRVYGQRYHAEVGEKYSSVRQKHHRKHRGAEYHKGRPNRGRKAMRLGEEQGHKYKTGRHGEPLVLLNDKWVGSDYFNERLANAAKRNNVAEAEAVYDEMVEICRLQPDVGTYNHLISVHGRRGNATRAFKYYQQIKKRALEANGYTYTSLFNACATGLLPDHELAMKLFDELAKKEIAMHTYHFNALLKVCAKIGDDEGALDVFETMMAQHNAPGLPPCQPDSRTYSHLLHAYKHSADVETAQDLLEVMVTTNTAVDSYVAVAFLAVCTGAMKKSRMLVTATAKEAKTHGVNGAVVSAAVAPSSAMSAADHGDDTIEQEEQEEGDDGMDKLLASEAEEQPAPTIIQPEPDEEGATPPPAMAVPGGGTVYETNVVQHGDWGDNAVTGDDNDDTHADADEADEETTDELQVVTQPEVFEAMRGLVDAMGSTYKSVDEIVIEHMLGVVEEADFRQVSKAEVQDHLSWLKEVTDKNGLAHDTRLANRWVSAYTRLGMDAEADVTLTWMRDNGVPYDSYTLTALTATPIRQGKFRESIGLLKYFVEQERVVPSDVTFTALIRHLKQQATEETKRKRGSDADFDSKNKWDLAVMVLEYRLQLQQGGIMPPPDKFLCKETQQLVVRGKQLYGGRLPLHLKQVIQLSDELIRSTAFSKREPSNYHSKFSKSRARG